MALIVRAGYVTVETAVPGGRAHIDIPAGQVLPDDVPAEQREQLLARGDVFPALEAEPEDQGEGDPDALPDGTVADVLAWVGDDKARAEQALEAEQAEGGKNRRGVVDPLTDLLTRPE